jgi:tRNA(Ile)-lysidine synthase
MRAVRGSGSTGLAGMAPLTETTDLRFLRPLLGFPPGRLRARLRAAGTPWAEDPTNADARFTRARLRALRADAQGCGPATRALTEAAGLFGTQRAAAEQETANFLAAQAEIRPEGFAHVSGPGPWPATALAQLLRMVTGAPYPPDPEHIARIAADPSGAIGRGLALAGARLLPAGRQGLGFLLCREESAMAAPVPAVPGAIWDGRFRVMRAAPVQSDMLLGALGDEAAGFRRLSDLPAAVLRTMPALRDSEGTLRAVPGLGWHAADENRSYTLVFAPLLPAAGAIFAAGLGRDLALRDRGHGETVPPP